MRLIERNNDLKGARKGVSLVITIFSIMLLAVLGLTMAMLISGDFEMNTREMESEQAFNLADAGINEAVSRLKANTTLFNSDAKWLNRKLGNGEYNVTRSTNGTRITVVSSGYVPSQKLRRAMRQIKLTVQSGISFGSGTAVYSTGNVYTYNNAHITGNVNQGVAPGTLPAVTVPNPPLNSPNSGILNVYGSNSVTLASGNYKYSSIYLSNNSKLNIYGPANIYLTGSQSFVGSNNSQLIIKSGPVNIYIDGALSMSNNVVIGSAQNAGDLAFFGTANNNKSINISNDVYFYGGIYAPYMNLFISNNGVYNGEFIGSSVLMSNNARINYDPDVTAIDIPGVGGGGSGSWQEQ